MEASMKSNLILLAIIAVAYLLRNGLHLLQSFRSATFGFIDVSVIVVFGLPLLEVVVVIATILPVSLRTRKIFLTGLFFLPVLAINAALRIYDYVGSLGDCETVSGGFLEFYCLTVGMQVFVHIPFLLISMAIMGYHFGKFREYKIAY